MFERVADGSINDIDRPSFNILLDSSPGKYFVMLIFERIYAIFDGSNGPLTGCSFIMNQNNFQVTLIVNCQ